MRPVAEDCIDAEDMSFRRAPAMIVALRPPPLAPGFSDAPQVLVMRMALGFCVCAPPDLHTSASRDDRYPGADNVIRLTSQSFHLQSLQIFTRRLRRGVSRGARRGFPTRHVW